MMYYFVNTKGSTQRFRVAENITYGKCLLTQNARNIPDFRTLFWLLHFCIYMHEKSCAWLLLKGSIEKLGTQIDTQLWVLVEW